MTAAIGDLWTRNPLATGIAGALLAILTLTLLAVTIIRIARTLRGIRNMKLQIGTTVVQAGVTWAVVTGVYDYCTKVLNLPDWEAAAFAVFLEAAMWVTVGRIIAHGRSTTDQGAPTTGFGPAGPFFWLFSTLGGVLAITGGETPGAMLGRGVIVTFGTCLWYLTLLTYTRPSGAPSRLRWTPRRLLVAIGALEPADQDVADEHQEWQIRRLARAMRWTNSRPPLRWIGRRVLISRAEQTSETVIEAARRRYAVAYLLATTVDPDSDVMRRVIAAVKAETNPSRRPATVADLVAATRPNPGVTPSPAASAAEPPASAAAPTETANQSNDEQPDKSDLIDAFILSAWAKGRRVTGADADRHAGTNPDNGLGRGRLRELRRQHPGREPGGNRAGQPVTGVNGSAVPELVGASSE